MLQAQALSSGTVSSPLGGNTATELVGSSSDKEWMRGDPQPVGVAVICHGQREPSSVLALAVGTWGLCPSSLGISGLCETDIGSQWMNGESQLACKEGREM